MEEGDVFDDSNESLKKGKINKRQRLMSQVNETQKMKLLNSENRMQKLEWEAVQCLNNQVLQKT